MNGAAAETPMATNRPIHGLYLILDPDACAGRPPVEVARLALAAGATVIQWRDKRRDKGDQLAEARSVARACAEAGATFIINDHADMVAATGAHGVHLGQHDLPIEAARALLGPGAIIGLSTNNPEEARAAEAAGADYIAVGAIFATASKFDTRPASLERLQQVKAAASVPVVAIGGINLTNIADVVRSGADAAAVISAVCAAPDIHAAAAQLSNAFGGLSQEAHRRDQLRSAIERYLAAINRRDRQGFIDAFTEDAVLQDPITEPAHIGHEAIGAWWDSVVLDGETFAIEVDGLHIIDDDAALAWTMPYTYKGQSHEARGVEILSFDGDRIASSYSYWTPRDAAQEQLDRIAHEYGRAVRDRDKTAFLALFAEEAVQQDPVGQAPRIGRAAIAAWWDQMMSTYPVYDFQIHHTATVANESAVTWSVRYQIDGVESVGAGVDVIIFDEASRIAAVHSYWEPEHATFRLAADQKRHARHQLVDRFLAVLNARDRAGFISLFTADCVVQVPHHEEPFVGIEGLSSWWDATIPGRPFRIRLDSAHSTRDDIAIVWTNVDDTPGSTTSVRGIEVLSVEGSLLSGVASYRTRSHEADPRPREAALAFTDAINSRDRAGYLALWSNDGMRQDPPDGALTIGIDAIGAHFDAILEYFPDYTMQIDTICVAGNEAALAWRTEDRSGHQPREVRGVDIITVDDAGKIASVHSYYEP